ncbi:MAG: hypothetical protein IPL46_03105 [Saprospiraceae bacterium]|nr:hypothetical protein [Saprospiraceae bacterium]
MVTDASWVDLDKDLDDDLVVVGDWMDIHIFYNDKGNLSRHDIIPQSKGWWTRIHKADLDLDGNMDLILGNWGLNSKFQASVQQPVTMFVNDFDLNNKSEFIINWYAPLDKIAYPFATKMELTKQLPFVRKQAQKYEDFAKLTYETLFDQNLRDQSISYSTNTMTSAILWNEGNGQLSLKALPMAAQISPVFGIVADDFTDDGLPDIWLGGNFYTLKPQVGRLNASRGVLLEATGGRNFTEVSPLQSGIDVKGEVRDAVSLHTSKGKFLLIARNNDDILVYQKESKLLK